MLTTHHVDIRRLEPHEAEGVVGGVFASLSLESRRLRFHVPMPRLPRYAQKQLASVDGSSHVAFAAWAGERAVGIGRLVTVAPGEAELALEVVDDWQGCGIGRRLLVRLAEQAADLGFQTLTADVLRENAAMLHLLRQVFPEARLIHSHGAVHVICPVRSAGCPCEELLSA